MTGIQLSGLSSGLDTDSIIAQLMSLEQPARAKIVTNQTIATTRKSALADIELKLKSVRDAAASLSSAASWIPTQTVDVEDATKIAATRTGGAAPGGYAIGVTRLATAAQQTFLWSTQSSASSITVNGNSVALAANTDIDTAVSVINASDSIGVYAVNSGGKLILSARTTGAASAFTASGGSIAADGSTPSRAGVDAQFTVNGGATQSSATNVVTNAVPGVSLTLKALTSSTTVSVGNPSPDTGAAVDRVKTFVSAYNDAIDALNTKVNEQKVKDPANDIAAATGSLFGDSGLRDTIDALRRVVSSPIPGLSAPSTLAEIGISTGAATGSGTLNADSVAGKLTLDEGALTAALTSNPVGVQKLLGGVSGTSGFAQSFSAVIEPLVQTNGVYDQRVNTIGTQLTDLADSLTRMDTYLANRQDQLKKQFTALEVALSQSSSIQSQLVSKLG